MGFLGALGSFLAFLFLFLGSSTLALLETFCSFLATLGMLVYLFGG